jgi:TRAP-type C4-dicarboxylate transport system permease large subunit
MIVYGVAAETSIGALFLAGIVPGLIMAGALMLMVRYVATRRNLPRHPFPGAAQLARAFRRAFWALMAPIVLFAGLLTGLTRDPLVYLAIVNVLLLVVGCFMEALAAMLVLIPILVPTAIALGIDPVQFGLVFVLNLMIGTITPPIGVVLYVTAKVANVPFERMARAVLPYLVPLFAVLVLVTVWPAASTFLPALLMGK